MQTPEKMALEISKAVQYTIRGGELVNEAIKLVIKDESVSTWWTHGNQLLTDQRSIIILYPAMAFSAANLQG